MTTEDSFYIRIFSSDSIDVYDNTLSSFTIDLENSLEFGDEQYEVALTSVILPPTSESMRRHFTDGIFIPSDKPYEFKNMDEFVSYLFQYACDPGHYTREYFGRFLDKGIVFDNYLLAARFSEEVARLPTAANLQTLTFSFKLEDLFGETEAKSFVNPKHFIKNGRTNMNEKVFKVKIPIPTDYPYSFKTILVMMIKKILYIFRGTDDYALFHRNFVTNLLIYDGYNEMMQHLHRHKINTNEVIQKFIEKFVEAIENHWKTHTFIEKVVYDRHIMLYTDLISPTLVSGSRTRMLHMFFIENPSNDTFVQMRYDNPMYFSVEKKSIKSMSFQLRGQSGNLVDFLPSYHSTHLTLHFRKISNGKQFT